MCLLLLILVPELDSRVNRPSCDQLKLTGVGDAGQFVSLRNERTLEAAKAEIETVDLVCRSDRQNIGSVRVVDHVTAELRDPDLEVSPVLSV